MRPTVDHKAYLEATEKQFSPIWNTFKNIPLKVYLLNYILSIYFSQISCVIFSLFIKEL